MRNFLVSSYHESRDATSSMQNNFSQISRLYFWAFCNKNITLLLLTLNSDFFDEIGIYTSFLLFLHVYTLYDLLICSRFARNSFIDVKIWLSELSIAEDFLNQIKLFNWNLNYSFDRKTCLENRIKCRHNIGSFLVHSRQASILNWSNYNLVFGFCGWKNLIGIQTFCDMPGVDVDTSIITLLWSRLTTTKSHMESWWKHCNDIVRKICTAINISQNDWNAWCVKISMIFYEARNIVTFSS